MEHEGYYLKNGALMPDRRSGKDRRHNARGGRRQTDSQELRYLVGANSPSVSQKSLENQDATALFDYEKGLALYNGDCCAYKKMLRSFLDRTETILDCIHEPQRVDCVVYQNLIRLMRSDFEDIAAPRLATMAQILEKAAKNRYHTIMEEDHDIFIALSYLLCIEVQTTLVKLADQADADTDRNAAIS